MRLARELVEKFPNNTTTVHDNGIVIFEYTPPLYRVMLNGAVWSNGLHFDRANYIAIQCRRDGKGMAYVELDQ